MSLFFSLRSSSNRICGQQLGILLDEIWSLEHGINENHTKNLPFDVHGKKKKMRIIMPFALTFIELYRLTDKLRSAATLTVVKSTDSLGGIMKNKNLSIKNSTSMMHGFQTGTGAHELNRTPYNGTLSY